MSFVQGKHGQLLVVSGTPAAGTMLTADGFVDSAQYMEAVSAYTVIPGSSVTVGTTYEAMSIGALTISGAGFEDNGAVLNNEVQYTGVPSGANQYEFKASIKLAATAAKQLQIAWFVNGVEAACADAEMATTISNKTAVVFGCGALAVNDVVSLKYKSADGAVVTVDRCRMMITQMR